MTARTVNDVDHDYGNDVRRARGVVYTPPRLAALVFERLMPERAVDDILLDPACGTGVFLVEGVRCIAAQLGAGGADEPEHDRAALLAAIQSRVYGVDVDSEALEVALGALHRVIQQISPGPLPPDYLRGNLIHADFLDEDSLAALPRAPRYIVGNPPYVSTATLDEAQRRHLRSRFTVALGRMDLYVLFMERCSTVLRDGGRWSLITPDKYLSSLYGAPVRRLLSTSGHVLEILRFSSHRVFDDAATVPCITVWEKAPSLRPTLLSDVRRSQHDAEGWDVSTPVATRAITLEGEAWQLRGRSGHPDLRERIVENKPVLADVATRISAGLATGLNAAFLVDDDCPVEAELLHPTVRGRDVQSFSVRTSHRRILVPYTWDENGHAQLIDLDKYPLTAEWLRPFRGALEARHCVRVWGKRWWDLHDPVTLALHRQKKVLVPDIARENRFAADDGTVVPQNTAYYILPRGVSPDILAALLNSQPIEYLMKATAPLMKDGFYRYRRQFLRELPVPVPTPDQQEALIDALGRGAHNEVSELTASLYGTDLNTVAAALQALAQDGHRAP